MEAAHLPNELFDLLAEKSYPALSEDEKLLVAQHLSASEYNELHALIKEVQLADQQHVVAPSRPSLARRKSWFHRILNYPIPAYQAAAAVALLIGSYWLWGPPVSSSEVDNTIPYVRTGTSIELDSYPDSLVFQL